MAVEIVAGFHVPIIEFVEVVGSAVGDAPMQKGPKAAKFGVTAGFTTMVMLPLPHEPEVGVNVYTVLPAVVVLMVDGFHVPLIALVEFAGRIPGESPTQ